ncbi:MAG: response regulator [Pseudomonadota bacterium]
MFRSIVMLIHLIEDDAAVRAALSVFLEEEGYRVAAFPNATSFFSQADPQSNDLIVLDVGLPDMPGPEVCDLLRARGVKAKIMAISGLKVGPYEAAIRRIAPIAAFRKPLNLPDLLASIAQYCAPQTVMSE